MLRPQVGHDVDASVALVERGYSASSATSRKLTSPSRYFSMTTFMMFWMAMAARPALFADDDLLPGVGGGGNRNRDGRDQARLDLLKCFMFDFLPLSFRIQRRRPMDP